MVYESPHCPGIVESTNLPTDNANEIRVLAVRQPWASLIVEGLKTIEVRSRPTNVRERVAIYSSNGNYTEEEKGDCICNFAYLAENKVISHEVSSFASRAVFHEPMGYIIGTVEIVDSVRPISTLEYEIYYNNHLAPFSQYKDGSTHFWMLKRPVKFSKPIPYKPPKGAVVWSKTVLPEGY